MKKKTQGRPAPKALAKLRPDYALARLFRETGLAVPHLSRIFRGKHKPGVHTVRLIAAALGVTMEQVIAALPRYSYQRK